MTLERSDSKNHPRALEVRFHAARMGFGGEALFETLDMFLPAGFITCLLGPSGVGKSTLLRLLAGLVPLSRADRLVCDDGKPLDGRVAYMDQRDLLFPWLRVIDNVMLGS